MQSVFKIFFYQKVLLSGNTFLGSNSVIKLYILNLPKSYVNTHVEKGSELFQLKNKLRCATHQYVLSI